jgi:hypothetical protein
VSSAERLATERVRGCDRRLRGDEIRPADVSSGSARDGHTGDVTAGKLTSKVGVQITDCHGT